MNKKRIQKIATDKSRAREVVNEILNFGVNDQQIVHIMFLLALNLESNEKMKDITSFLKKYEERVNEDDEDVKIESSKTKKIILT